MSCRLDTRHEKKSVYQLDYLHSLFITFKYRSSDALTSASTIEMNFENLFSHEIYPMMLIRAIFKSIYNYCQLYIYKIINYFCYCDTYTSAFNYCM